MSVYQLLWSTAGGGVDHSVPFRLGTAVRRADVRDGVKWQLLSCFCLHELSAFSVAPAPRRPRQEKRVGFWTPSPFFPRPAVIGFPGDSGCTLTSLIYSDTDETVVACVCLSVYH